MSDKPKTKPRRKKVLEPVICRMTWLNEPESERFDALLSERGFTADAFIRLLIQRELDKEQ